MWRYLLDANAIVVFERSGRLGDLISAAGSVPMALAEEVCDELLKPRSSTPAAKRRGLEAALKGGEVEIRSIFLGSPEAAVRAELLKEKTNSRGRGEAASIALAAYDADLVLVTEDWNAVKKAYRELHSESGRAIRLHSFLRVMVERGALPRDTAFAAATAAKQESNIEPPIWWAAWAKQSTDAADPAPPDTSARRPA